MGQRSRTNVKDAQTKKAIKEGVECALGKVQNGQRRNEVKDVQTMLRKEDVYQAWSQRRR
jgi:hypothetical protein|eukprot:scaffold10070_cov115-Skeletonema_marinoi.AAC.4